DHERACGERLGGGDADAADRVHGWLPVRCMWVVAPWPVPAMFPPPGAMPILSRRQAPHISLPGRPATPRTPPAPPPCPRPGPPVAAADSAARPCAAAPGAATVRTAPAAAAAPAPAPSARCIRPADRTSAPG